jgi:hypothetical protein
MTANGALAAAAVSLMDVPERGDGLQTLLLRNNEEKLVQRHSNASALVPFGMAFIIGIGLSILFMGIGDCRRATRQFLALLADAGHNFLDALGLIIAGTASFLTKRAHSFSTFPPIPFKLSRIFKCMAEREGFEPSVRLPVLRFSRPAYSTTLAPLQGIRCRGSRPGLNRRPLLQVRAHR